MVGFLKRFASNVGGDGSEVEEYLDTLGIDDENMFEEEADVWIKYVVLQEVSDATVVGDELSNGNIVLLNIEPLMKRNSIKLKQAVSKIKGNVRSVDGDIARLSEYKLLISPKGIKVFRK